MVSWRWLIDVRGERTKVDWPRLAVVIASAQFVVGAALWSVYDQSVLGGILVAFALAATLVAWDIWLRRRKPDA